jgi:hypothetical protein
MTDKFEGVARLIIVPPPKWLAQGLEYFSEGIRTGAEWKPGEREQYENRMKEMAEATDTLLKYLPAFYELPFGIQPPIDVMTMQTMQVALLEFRIELKLLMLPQQGGRKPLIAREICAAVIVEAWRLARGDRSMILDDPETDDPKPPPPVIDLALGQAITRAVEGRVLPAQDLSVGPRSERVQHACNEYWLACGCKEIGETGDIENWRRPLERAIRSDRFVD